MNSNIKKLLEQSTYDILGVKQVDQKKFAELIVRECAGVVAAAVDYREPASTYVDRIKQHFGVE